MDKKCGIINYSTNCYLNVIIQLFLYNKNTSNIIIQYLDLIKSDNQNNSLKRLFNPKRLMDKLNEKINVVNQNDSQEAFTLLLDLIPELEKHYDNQIKYTYMCKFRMREM